MRHAAPARRTTDPTRRNDLEGLRALAIGLVVVYHLSRQGVSGGVDVFLFLSGYFVLGSQLRKISRGERVPVLATWARTARRLIPAAWLVLTVTVIAAVVIAPRRQLLEILQQGLSSGFYAENWWLIENGQAYGATASFLNPFQHFWSLSVQGQIFLLAPLVSLLALTLIRRQGGNRLPHIVAGMGAVTLGLFVLALVLVSQNQTTAYLSTAARAWQFALGGLMALVIPLIALSPPLRMILGWVGLILVLITGVVVDGQATFPGFPALLPLTGAMLIVLAGVQPTRYGIDRVLGHAPIAALGKYAYGLYLWHWPILALYLLHSGRESLGPKSVTAIVGLSILLAVATHHLVEKPWIRDRSSRTTNQARSRVAIGLAASLALFAGGTAVLERGRIDAVRSAQSSLDPSLYPGARHIIDPTGFPSSNSASVPDPTIPDIVAFQEDRGPTGCTHFEFEPGLHCRFAYSSPTLGDSPTLEIAVVGGSHASQVSASIKNEFGDELLVRDYIRSSCPLFSATSIDELTFDVRNAENCLRWNEEVLADLLSNPPDLVVAMLSRPASDGRREQVPDSYIQAFSILNESEIPTLAVRMFPSIETEAWKCLQEAHANPPCSAPRELVLENDESILGVNLPPYTTILDTTPYWCPDGQCPAAIGNVSVFQDRWHLSDYYVNTMGFAFRQAIETRLA